MFRTLVNKMIVVAYFDNATNGSTRAKQKGDVIGMAT